MRRIGIDVGGTNTDAVLLADGAVVHAVKTPTTADVTAGIVTALAELAGHPDVARGVIDSVVIGTTHFVNAVVQRRDISRVAVVRIMANPCFGLDFAAVAEIRARIVQARNRGAAVLLVSEDLDEILQLSDRIVVMSDGKLALQTEAAGADVSAIGRAMAGH